jgi:hypothetical protein
MPRFNIAYRFGSLFLAEKAPGGAGRPDLAIKLLEKGLAATPDKWEYMLDVGFIHYWWTHDYRAAADWFLKASGTPNAPSWLRPLAAATVARGGDRRSSRAMWEALRATSDNEWIRAQADWRLLQLQALDEIDVLQRLVDRARAAGVAVQGWQSFRLRAIPSPTRLPFDDARPDGRVHVAAVAPPPRRTDADDCAVSGAAVISRLRPPSWKFSERQYPYDPRGSRSWPGSACPAWAQNSPGSKTSQSSAIPCVEGAAEAALRLSLHATRLWS